MTNTSKIIFGLLGAAAAGVAIGMLMAPEKGADMRRKISDGANDLACRVSDLFSSGKEKLSDVMNGVARKADQVKESVG